jgi:hypothetical protein
MKVIFIDKQLYFLVNTFYYTTLCKQHSMGVLFIGKDRHVALKDQNWFRIIKLVFWAGKIAKVLDL